MPRFFVGLDLAQSKDYNAVALIERVPQTREEKVFVMRYSPRLGQNRRVIETQVEQLPPHYYVHDVWRFPLGMRYTQVVDAMQAYLGEAPIQDDAKFIIDLTGVGRPVYDMFTQAGLYPIPITITGGNEATRAEGGGWHVPKRDLIGALEVTFDGERIKLHEDLQDRALLEHELTAFRRSINSKTAHDSYGAWRERDHDDMVLAIALAVWYAETHGRYDVAPLDEDDLHMLMYGF